MRWRQTLQYYVFIPFVWIVLGFLKYLVSSLASWWTLVWGLGKWIQPGGMFLHPKNKCQLSPNFLILTLLIQKTSPHQRSYFP